MENALQKRAIRFAALRRVDLVDAPGCPGVNGRVGVAERPFISRKLPVGVHVPFARQQFKLALGEVGIEQHQRDAVTAQIPTGIPGIFPLVRHRNHVEVVQVLPLGVAPIFAAFGRCWHPRIALEPLRHIVIVKLLRPEHPGERLPLDGAHVGAERFALDGVVEFVRFIAAMLINTARTRGKDARSARASGADAALSFRRTSGSGDRAPLLSCRCLPG